MLIDIINIRMEVVVFQELFLLKLMNSDENKHLTINLCRDDVVEEAV